MMVGISDCCNGICECQGNALVEEFVDWPCILQLVNFMRFLFFFYVFAWIFTCVFGVKLFNSEISCLSSVTFCCLLLLCYFFFFKS